MSQRQRIILSSLAIILFSTVSGAMGSDALAVDAPTMEAEPSFSQGTTNTVLWSDESGSGATAYYAEVATSPSFSTVADSSGWIAGTTHTFTGLTDGQIYYYRAKARDADLNESGWSNVVASIQDDTPPTSSVGSLPAEEDVLTFDVSYTAIDFTSGVASVELFYQVDGGGYSSYGTFTSSPVSFTADGDGFYQFYTVATDNAGNVEDAPGSADASTTVTGGSPDAPTMTAEPSYTAGTSNTVAWSDESGSGATSYYVEAATDAGFTTVVDNSGWIAGTSDTFTGLTDGQIYYYRAKARDTDLDESGWSNVESSTQDDTAPISSVDALGSYQNTLTFDVPYTASDATSGLASIELLYQVDGGGYSSYGTFTASPISFTASGDGLHEFYTVATDNVGNVEDTPASADESTTVDTASPDAPTLAAEPTYTQGTANGIIWSDEAGTGATASYAEVATDLGFTTVVDNSGWIADTTHTFTGLTDGQIHYYRTKSRDAAQNESTWSNVESSTQDDTAPASSVDTLSSEQDTLSFDVAYTVSDATSGVASVELYFQVDGGGYSSYGTFTSSPIGFTASGEGFYEFYTIGTDNIGNVEGAPASADASTTIDTTPVDAPTLTAEPAYTLGTGNTVAWSDESAGGATAYYAETATDAGFTSVFGNSGWISDTTHAFTGLTDDQIYYYRVKARDSLLRESFWSNVEFSTQDDSNPVSSVDPLPSHQNALTFDVAYTATDATSGVASVELFYQVDGGGYSSYGTYTGSPVSFTASGDGFYEFYTVTTDSVGNVEDAPASADASTTVDTDAPDAPTMAGEPSFTQGTSNTIAWSDESASGATEYYAEVATSPGFTVVLDNSGWIAGTSHTFTGLSDGQIYYYRAKAWDAAHNESGWSNLVVSIQDAIAPESSVGSLPSYQDVLTFDVSYTATDLTSGVASVELFFQVDGGGYGWYGTFTSSPISFTATEDGLHEFYTIATDNVGNVEDAPASADASTTVDAAPPNIPVLDEEPAYTQGLSNTILWSEESGTGATAYYTEAATDAGFSNVVDNSGWIADTTHAFTGLTNGQIYHYRTKARDEALNESTWSDVEFSTQDDTAPASSVDALPAYQGTLTFDVAYGASDATSGIDSVELFFQVDGAGYSSYGTFAGSPISFTASGDGFHEFYTVATDGAGNVENAPASADASTTVDTAAPTTPTLTTEPIYTQGTSNTVAWSDESGSGAAEYYAEVATDAGFSNVVGNSGWISDTSYEFSGLTDAQTYHYRAKSRDLAENESGWSNVESSTQDDIAPISSVDTLPAFQDSLTFDVSYTASDAVSGVASVELFFQVDGGGYGSYGTYTSSPISFTAVEDGLHEFYTVAADIVGNEEDAPASADASTTVDAAPPSSPTMVEEPAYTAGTSNTVAWSDESETGAVDYYAEVASDAGFTSVVDNSGWIADTTHTFSGLTNGQIYYYRAKGRDDALNESAWSAVEFSTQDDAAPTSSVDPLSAYQTSLTFDVPYTASDASSGVDSVELFYRVDGGGYSSFGVFTASPISFTAGGDGFYEFYTLATDNVGNVEAAPGSADASTTVDIAPPDAPFMAAEPTYTEGTSNTVNWSDESGSGATAYYAELATSPSFGTVLDNSGWVAGTSHEFTGLTDGLVYYYRVKARDALLRDSAWSNTVASIQDDTVPISSVDTLPAELDTLQFNISYTASDGTSGVESVELFFQVDGGGYTSYGSFTSSPIDFMATGEGLYEFYTVATDYAGIVEDPPGSADASTTISLGPPNAPPMTAEPPYSPGTSNSVSWHDEAGSGATAYFTQIATDAGFASVVDTTGWITETTHEFTGLTDTQIYYYQAKARNDDMEESSWSNTVFSTQDDADPTSSVDPLSTYQTALTFDVPYTASDLTSGVASVELFFQLDGGGYSSFGTFTASPISFTASGDGFYEFYSVATDGAGNVEEAPASADASTTIDSTPPDIPTLAGEPVYTQGTSNTIIWSDESASGATAYYAEAATDAGFAAVIDNTGWGSDTTYTFTGLTDGQIYYYRAKTRDEIQNESAWSAVEFSTQDDTAPSSSVGALPPYQTALTFDLSYTADDLTSGVASVELFSQVNGGGYSSYGTFTESPISFTGSTDGFYEFYTVATDNVGFVEDPPASADASTTIDTIAPDVPIMTAEPEFTQGTSNTVIWSDEAGSGAVGYYAEVATDAGFANVIDNSGWIAGTAHAFTGLTDGDVHYYRTKARDAATNESGWSNVESTTQDATVPTSSVDALPPYQGSLTFDVAYTASDGTSGLASVELFFQVNGGGYSSYGSFASSPISFTAGGDGLYEFYTIATDNVGLVEDAPASADASTEIDTSIPTNPILDAEPPYTAGTANTVSWGAVGFRESPVSYFTERASDAGFTTDVVNSGWISETAHEFAGLVDGQAYYYRAMARDAANNESGWSAIESSTQDDTAPTSSADPLPTYTGSLTFDVAYTASDATSGLNFVTLYYRVDGGGYSPYGSFFESPISFTASGDGFYEFYTVATDNAGLVEEAPAAADASTEIDTATPDTPTLDAEPTYTAGTSNTVSWNAVGLRDAPVGYQADRATDAGFTTDVVSSGWITEPMHEFAGLVDGQIYYYRVKARDEAQNESAWSATESSTQDDSAPTSSVDPLPDYQTTFTFDVAYTATDGTSGVASVELFFQVNDGGYSSYGIFTESPISFTAGDGFYEFYTVAIDNAGLLEDVPASADATTTIDTIAPDVPVMTAEPEFTQGTINTVSWSDEAGSGAVGYYAEIATDAGFVDVIDNSGWIAGTSHEFTGLADGQTHYYRTKTRDAATNESGWSNVESTTQDATVPTSSVDALPPYQGSLTFDVAYAASDGTSGLASVELFFQVNGGGYGSYGSFTSSPISFTASGDGLYEFYTVATDNVGLVEDAPASADATTEIDTTVPLIPTLDPEPVYSPGTNNTISWGTVGFRDAPVSYFAERASDAGFTTDLVNSGWITETSYEFTGLVDGQIYYYRVKARDAAQNESGWSATESSTQDDTAPNSNVLLLPPYTGTLTFDVPYSASDGTSGIASVELFFQVDGGGYGSYGSFTASPIGFTASGEGLYEFYTVATDNVGLVEEAPASADAATEIDTSTPAIPVLDVEPPYTAGTSNTVSWGAVGLRDAPVTYTAERATDVDFTTDVVSSGPIAETSYEFTGLADGQTYYYRVLARDAAQNETDWSEVESSVQDDSAPESNVETLGAIQDTLTFDLSYVATDATSGVDFVELYFQVDGEGYSSYGTFTESPISFAAGGDGFYEFYTIATDNVGLIEAVPDSADASTTVDTAVNAVTEPEPPTQVFLRANHPNPFSATTTIAFGLPEEGWAKLTIYDIHGRRIRTLVQGALPAGEHRFDWDRRDASGRTISGGVYLYRLETGNRAITRKMVISE